MAESVGELFIRMGVDTSELDSGFVSAERTVMENLARLNREQHMIQIRGQIELDGLEETASASEKVRVQAEALTKQMEIQRDKIAMVSTEATSELRENNPAKVLDEEFAKAESSINNSWGGIESETERAADKIENTTAEINESISEMGESAEETADEVEGVFDLLQTEDVGDAIKKANDLFKDSDSILGRLGNIGNCWNDKRVRGVDDKGGATGD